MWDAIGRYTMFNIIAWYTMCKLSTCFNVSYHCPPYKCDTIAWYTMRHIHELVRYTMSETMACATHVIVIHSFEIIAIMGSNDLFRMSEVSVQIQSIAYNYGSFHPNYFFPWIYHDQKKFWNDCLLRKYSIILSWVVWLQKQTTEREEERDKYERKLTQLKTIVRNNGEHIKTITFETDEVWMK